MKKRVIAMIILGTAGMLTGCSTKPVSCKTTSEDITVELSDISWKSMNERDSRITALGVITNQKEEAVSRVFYTVTFFDRKEEVLDEVRMFYVGDEAIEPGGSITMECSAIGKLKQKPAEARVEITDIKTVAEMPVERVPQPGEFLYELYDDVHLKQIKENPPVTIEAYIDRMGFGQKAVFTKEDGLDAALDAFLQMKLGADNAPMVTDNYNYIRLIWADDTSIMFRFNLYALELQANGRYHSYYVEQSEPFWNLVHTRIGR